MFMLIWECAFRKQPFYQTCLCVCVLFLGVPHCYGNHEWQSLFVCDSYCVFDSLFVWLGLPMLVSHPVAYVHLKCIENSNTHLVGNPQTSVCFVRVLCMCVVCVHSRVCLCVCVCVVCRHSRESDAVCVCDCQGMFACLCC